MTILLIALGALFGALAAGFSGLVLGAGFGFALGLLMEVRDRVDRMEDIVRALRTPQRHTQKGTAPSPSTAPAKKERYPEEPILNAMRRSESDAEAEGRQMDEYYHDVNAGPRREES